MGTAVDYLPGRGVFSANGDLRHIAEQAERGPAIEVAKLANSSWHSVHAGLLLSAARGSERRAELAADEADLWRIPLPVSPLVLSDWYRLLSPAERLRQSQFRRTADWTRFLVGRAAVRILIACYTGIAPSRLSLSVGKNGKPLQVCDDERERIHFNVSHSGNWVQLAFARCGPVGIDVEEILPIEVWDLARVCLDDPECEFVTSSEVGALGRFYRLWTRKEALLKATGEGIGPQLRHIRVVSCGGAPITIGNHVVSDLEMPDGYAAAAALPLTVRAARLMQAEPLFEGK